MTKHFKILDETMAPEFQTGDAVIVQPSATPRDGDIVVVVPAGEVGGMLRKFEAGSDGAFSLVPFDCDYPTMVVSKPGTVEIVGVVTEHDLDMLVRD